MATGEDQKKLGPSDARHLLRRVGLGIRSDQVAALELVSRADAVSKILGECHTSTILPQPDWAEAPFIPPADIKAMSDADKRTFQQQRRQQGMDLRGWWVAEMLSTPSPLTEKMTLFWHNHFTSSLQKVKSPQFMLRQNQLLRRLALGNFRDLLHGISRDPAMVVYLDNVSNRRGEPNENFARELMELFTLGEGHYTEEDVREAARAFTGWGLNRQTGTFEFHPRLHDEGIKTILGQKGAWNGDDVLDILLKSPQTAIHICSRLWQAFVDPRVEAGVVADLAATFRTGWSIRDVLYQLFTSDHFYHPAHRAVIIKSPVDLVVGTLRTLGTAPRDRRILPFTLRGLGQDLMAPPNVKGWPGGTSWITSQTLLSRQQFLRRLVLTQELTASAGGKDGEEPRPRRVADPTLAEPLDVNALCKHVPDGDRARARALGELLLATDPVRPLPEQLDPEEVLSFVDAALQDPVYQLL